MRWTALGTLWLLSACESSRPAQTPDPAATAPRAEVAAESAVAAAPSSATPAAAPSTLSELSGSRVDDAAGLGGLGVAGTGASAGPSGNAMGGLGLKGSGVGGGGHLGTFGSGSGVAAGRGLGGRAGVVRLESASGETYGATGINGWVETASDRLSTFAVDVDTASYAIARRKLREGQAPPPESVRVEEFINAFRYQLPQPKDGALGVTLEAAPSPFTARTAVLRVSVQGRRLSISERKPAHLTFLVDVSGSMNSPDKLPLAQRALRILVDSLRDGDTVSLVTYAGAVRVVLPHTGLEQKARIHEAIEGLRAGGGTAMGSGIELAYQQAAKVLDGKSVSRIVILSDGDANIGPARPNQLLRLIAGYVKEGVTVTTVGFGMGTYRDDLMEQFANKGNGNHHYVDSLFEAKRIFHTELGGTLEVIAKDVKLQVEFDPEQVKRYRLIGYENRDVADHDFRNDRVDAGEIGSGHTVTALYELELAPGAGAGLCTVRVRAKPPVGERAAEAFFPFEARWLAARFDAASDDLRFATAVMGAAEVFRRSPHARHWSLEGIREIAAAAALGAPERQEFLELIDRARPLLRPVAAR